MVGMKMPLKYVIEMFVDRVAASKNYLGDKYNDRSALEYYNKGKEHYIIHKDTKKTLEELLNMLASHGEDYTFNYIKDLLLK